MPVKYSKLSAGPSTRRTAGEKTEPTASDAAQAMTELAKAGLSVQDSLDAARGTLQLATAAQMTKAELVALAKHWGLPAEGTKADLILRLSE